MMVVVVEEREWCIVKSWWCLREVRGIRSLWGLSRRLLQSTFSDCIGGGAGADGIGLRFFRRFVQSEKRTQVLPHMPPERRKFVHDVSSLSFNPKLKLCFTLRPSVSVFVFVFVQLNLTNRC